jgi:long-subunit acyl-CoA synthetase (AMP-forming)
MVGYFNNPKANEEAFLYRDGKKFFKTGDMGLIVDRKVTLRRHNKSSALMMWRCGLQFLKLTGRIKEQFKLENGK